MTNLALENNFKIRAELFTANLKAIIYLSVMYIEFNYFVTKENSEHNLWINTMQEEALCANTRLHHGQHSSQTVQRTSFLL